MYDSTQLRHEVREFVKLAVPLASAQVAQSATGFADTVMMGRMGAETLAAGGLASVVFMSILASVTGIVMGVSPLIAEAFGAGQKNRIQHVARQGLWLALLISVPTMILVGHLDAWLGYTGQTATTVRLANIYLDIMLWALFPAIGFATLRATVAALSHAQPIIMIVVAGTAFNIVWNYILGFGKFGFPALGIAGLAIASVMSFWLMFLSLALYILLHPKLRDYQILQTLYQLNPGVLRELLSVGVPIGIFSSFETSFFMIITFLMGTLGTEVLAAHQIMFQTIVVVFMVPLGISFATTVRVGQWLGQRDRAGIQRAAYVSIVTTTLFMIAVSILFLLFPKQVIGIYLDTQNPDNAAIVNIALPLLTIAAIAQVLDGFQRAVYGALQGLQDTKIPMLLNVLGFWCFGLSTGYILGFQLGLGSVGLWIGQSIGIATSAGLFFWRFRRLLSTLKL